MLSRVGVMVVALLAALVLLAGPASAAQSTAARWPMDETSGTTMHDATSHDNDGTLKNVQLRGADGYGFNGHSSVVIVPDADSLDPGTADLVVSVRVAFTEVPDDDYDLIRKGLAKTAGGDWKIEIVNVDGKAIARCYLRGANASWQKTTGPDLADGKRHTITCEKHATSAVLSVDGQIWKASRSIGNIANNAVLSIGAKAEGGDWYEGVMDEVSVKTGS